MKSFIIVMIILKFCVINCQCCAKIDNEFILDYFLYKKTSTVIGFTCNNDINNLDLIRKLSESNTKSAFWKLDKTIRLSTFTNQVYWKIGIFFDLRCYYYENITATVFSEVTNYKMFGESFHWLVIGQSLNKSLELIDDTFFGLSTDFAIGISQKNNYILYDIYNPCKIRGGSLNITFLGSWNLSSRFNFLVKYKKTDRWNLQGMDFKISGLVNNRPDNLSLQQHLVDYSQKQIDSVVKLSYSIWIPLAEMFNFTLNYHEKSIWKKGDKNGLVVNALSTGEVDATETPATLTLDRSKLGKVVYAAIPFRVVSARLNNPFKRRNDSLDQLRKMDLSFASEKSLYFDYYMKKNDSETRSFYLNKWLKIPESKRFIPPNKGLTLISHGGFAYHTLPEVAYPFAERFFNDRQICELAEVHLVRPIQLCFFVHMNSSFTEMMKFGFAKITESGIRNREIKRWLAKKPLYRMDILTIEEVTLYVVAPAFIFWTLSAFLAWIVLGTEQLIYFNRKPRRIRLTTFFAAKMLFHQN